MVVRAYPSGCPLTPLECSAQNDDHPRITPLRREDPFAKRTGGPAAPVRGGGAATGRARRLPLTDPGRGGRGRWEMDARRAPGGGGALPPHSLPYPLLHPWGGRAVVGGPDGGEAASAAGTPPRV